MKKLKYKNSGMVVKTKDGDFRLFDGGKKETKVDLGDDLIVPHDDIVLRSREQDRKKKAKAYFYFDVEDELEASQHEDKKSEDINYKIQQFIGSVIEEIFFDERSDIFKNNNEKQLKSVVLSRLRGVRNLANIREKLQQFLKNDYTKEDLSDFLDMVESKRILIEDAIRTGSIPRIELNQRARQKKEEIENKKEDVKKYNEKELEFSKENDVVEVVENDKSSLVDTSKEYKKEDKTRQELLKSEMIGPIEELRRMTLVEFRRLGDTPSEATDRIMEKINLLEDESLLKKTEGITAWKQSEVNKLYLAIGAESIASKKPIEKVVADRQAEGKPFLSLGEFEVIADLNRGLVY